MAQRYLFFNSVNDDRRIYQAQDFADYFGSVLSTGLLHEDNVPGLEVSVETGTMNTVVDAGSAIMRGHLYINDTPHTLTHALAEPTADRIDRVVLRLDLRNAHRNILLHIKEGVPSANPEPPALQRDAFIYELSLAQVRIRANTSTIDPSDVTDERLDDDVCGLVYSLLGNSYLQSQIDDIDSQLTQIAQKPHEIIFVGDNADFSNINEALEELSKRHARFWKEGYTAEILLKSGFVMQEQVIAKDVDLGWITISSEDTEVIINRASLTRDWFFQNNYPAFAAQGARLPRINVLFNMNSTGSADGRDGIVLAEQASIIISSEKGIKNAGRIGLSVGRMSFAVAHNAVISGSNDTNVYVAGSGMLLAENADLKNAGNYCIRIEGGSSASVTSADARGGGNYGLYAARGSTVHANNINARRGSDDSNTDIVVAQGGIINAFNSTGGTYITPNTLTSNGIIFK